MSLFISRLQLARDPSLDALSALLNPPGDGPQRDAHHRLVWSAFAGDPAAARDFLVECLSKLDYSIDSSYIRQRNKV